MRNGSEETPTDVNDGCCYRFDAIGNRLTHTLTRTTVVYGTLYAASCWLAHGLFAYAAIRAGETRVVGPWEVSVSGPTNAPTDRTEKVFSSFDQFMDGKIQYALSVPISKQTHENNTNEDRHNCDGSDGTLDSPLELVGAPTSSLVSTPPVAELRFVAEFSKQTRPTAWKGVDTKIQSVLPLPGIADGENRLLLSGAPSTTILVRLTLSDTFVGRNQS